LSKVEVIGSESWLCQKVMDFFKPTNYTFCDDIIVTDQNQLGIYKDDPELKPRKFLWWTEKFRKMHLGTLYFRNNQQDEECSDSERNWVFNVYGDMNLKEAEELALKLADKFEVNIKVILLNKDKRYEVYPCDLAF
jgi:hypothetical protein